MSEMRSKGLFDHDNLEIRKTLSDRACYTGSRSHQDLTFWATPSKTSVRAVYRRDANGARIAIAYWRAQRNSRIRTNTIVASEMQSVAWGLKSVVQIPRVIRSAGKIDRRAGCRMAGPPLKFQFRRTAASFVDLRSPTKQVASYTI